MVRKSIRVMAIVFLGFFLILKSAVIAQPPPEPEPDITVTDSLPPVNDHQLPFGYVTLDNPTDHTITVNNDGNVELIIDNIAQADPLINEFIILNDNCSGETIAPLSGCTFTVRFSPTTADQFSDTFDIPSDDPDEDPVTVTLNGTGAASPVQDISVTDSIGSAHDLLMPFDSLIEGLSLERIIEITNEGNENLVIGTIAQADPLINEFSILNDNCSGQTITPLSECTFTVRFSPATTDQFSDTFDIPSDDPDEDPVTVTVSGTGLSSAMNSAPVIPKLVAPVDGQTGMGTTVQFRWEESSDPDGDNLTYILQYCENDNFIDCSPIQTAFIENKVTYFAGNGIEFLLFGIVCAGSLKGRRKIMLLLGIFIMSAIFFVSCGGGGSSGNSPAAPINEITQEVSGLNTGTTHYWKITADDGNGGLIESEVRSFTTQ
jgi:hypothetical protein